MTTAKERLGGGGPVVWSPADAARRIAVPSPDDDKYSRGVLGVITGSARYPGAAVIGVEAALRTGVGMVRYLGDPHPSELVLRARPEAVMADGRVQAWLIGSGMDAADRDRATVDRIHAAIRQEVPVVLDGGALDLHGEARGPVVITPHYRELARLLGADAADIAADPAGWASRAASDLGVTVLLKGHTTHVVGPDVHLVARSGTPWLATAGSGDALGGILGALVATHAVQIAEDPAELARLAATAAVLHGLAATRASGGGPFVVMDLASALPAAIAGLLSS